MTGFTTSLCRALTVSTFCAPIIAQTFTTSLQSTCLAATDLKDVFINVSIPLDVNRIQYNVSGILPIRGPTIAHLDVMVDRKSITSFGLDAFCRSDPTQCPSAVGPFNAQGNIQLGTSELQGLTRLRSPSGVTVQFNLVSVSNGRSIWCGEAILKSDGKLSVPRSSSAPTSSGTVIGTPIGISNTDSTGAVTLDAPLSSSATSTVSIVVAPSSTATPGVTTQAGSTPTPSTDPANSDPESGAARYLPAWTLLLCLTGLFI